MNKTQQENLAISKLQNEVIEKNIQVLNLTRDNEYHQQKIQTLEKKIYTLEHDLQDKQHLEHELQLLKLELQAYKKQPPPEKMSTPALAIEKKGYFTETYKQQPKV